MARRDLVSFHPDLLNPRLGGYEVIGCEIKDRDTLYLLAREDVDQMEIHRRWRGGPPEGKKAKRLIGLRLDDLGVEAGLQDRRVKSPRQSPAAGSERKRCPLPLQ